jgi:hypothetical protein
MVLCRKEWHRDSGRDVGVCAWTVTSHGIKGKIEMQSRTRVGVLLALLALSPALLAQSSKPEAASNKNFDPRDLNGSWIGVRQGVGDFNPVPEPPLTTWAKEHLLVKNISHAGLNATSKGAASSGSLAEGVAAVDANGVPTNVPNGHYPGENCEPEGVPVEFNYPQYPFLFIVLPDRIYQMFENHREWRTIWLNRDHPKGVFPSYFGDSVAKWDGNTLVVDTTGYNGRLWISENIGHYMSDAFHLVERYRLTDATHVELEMTYYDPKAWGDKPWPGWKREFKLDSKGDSLEEALCDPAHWRDYDREVTDPVKEIK